MKRIKVCDHCDKKLKNRQSLHNHLASFHRLGRTKFSLMLRHICSTPPLPRESKPLRRVRMMMNAARRKKERELVSRKAHNHGVQRFR